jgi:outer membrane protein OmpA-like peptidoglycan-associated protein
MAVRRVTWQRVTCATISVAVTLLAACAEDPQVPEPSSDPNYVIVLFDSGSATLNKQAKQKLSDFVLNPGEPVKAVLKPDSTKKVCVTGHADGIGSETENRELGQRRAAAAAKYLIELGAPEKRIVITSMGSSKPLVITPPNTSAAANRRVEIVFGC